MRNPIPLALVLASVVLAGCVLPLPEGTGGRPGSARDAGPDPLVGQNLTVHVIDVGQGDAILIVTPGGRTLLMDAGPRDAGREVIAYLRAANVTRLDVFVASHGDADHIGGVGTLSNNVLDAYPPRDVYEPGFPKTTATYRTFLEAVDRSGAGYHTAQDFRPGDTLPLDPSVTITFLHPYQVDETGDPNDQGIILRLAYGNVSILLPGDASTRVERDLLTRGLPLGSTLLKVGHHGSRGSSGADFLAAVSPDVAVVSVSANNTYGHPHPEALARLEAAGIPLYRTDRNGSVVFRTDGESWDLVPERGSPRHGGGAP